MPCSVSANCKRTYPNHPPIGDQRCLSDGGVRSSSGATPALDIGDRQEQGWTEPEEKGNSRETRDVLAMMTHFIITYSV